MFISDYNCCWACSKESRWSGVLLSQGWWWRGTSPVVESNWENKPRRVRIVVPVASTGGSRTAANFFTSGLPSSFLSGRTAAQVLVVRIRWGVVGTADCFPFCYTELLPLTQTHNPLLFAHASLGYCLFSVFLQEKDSSARGFSLHRYAGPWPLWEGSREVHCGGGQWLWQWGSAWRSEEKYCSIGEICCSADTEQQAQPSHKPSLPTQAAGNCC